VIKDPLQVGIRRLQRKIKEKMAGWAKGGHGITHPGSYMDCTRPSNLEKNPKGAAVAFHSSTAKAISQVSQRPTRYFEHIATVPRQILLSAVR